MDLSQTMKTSIHRKKKNPVRNNIIETLDIVIKRYAALNLNEKEKETEWKA